MMPEKTKENNVSKKKKANVEMQHVECCKRLSKMMKHKSQEGDKMQQPSTKEILQFNVCQNLTITQRTCKNADTMIHLLETSIQKV